MNHVLIIAVLNNNKDVILFDFQYSTQRTDRVRTIYLERVSQGRFDDKNDDNDK